MLVNGHWSCSSLLRTVFSTGYGRRGEALPILSRPPATYSHTPQVSTSEARPHIHQWAPQIPNSPQTLPRLSGGHSLQRVWRGRWCRWWWRRTTSTTMSGVAVDQQWSGDRPPGATKRYPDCSQVPGRASQILGLTYICEKQASVVPSVCS